MVALVSTLLNAVIIAFLVRRLVGAPIGWPRTIVCSAVVGLAAGAVIDYLSALTGMPRSVSALDALSAEQRVGYVLVLALCLAWLLAGQATVLTIAEVFLPTGTLPDPVTWLRGLPGRIRRNRRYAQILRIVARHGLGSFLRTGSVSRGDSSVPARVSAALVDGGVTFVKLGQTLATRADLIPEPYLRELSALHSEVPAAPWEVVGRQVAEELGRPSEEVFAHIDEQPLAAASVAQVHRARLHTGEAVVLKVQRADARAQATADLDIVLRLGEWAQRRTGWGRRIGAADLAHGFADALNEELDYRIEVANMATIAQASRGDVRVPRVHEEFCTPRLIVMEEVAGQPLSRSAEALAGLSDEVRAGLAGDLFDSVLGQVMGTGVFHADLHPGNILLEPGTTNSQRHGRGGPRLTLLDFGSVGRLDRTSRDALGLFLLAFERGDAMVATDALVELLGRPDGLDDRGLEREVGGMLLSGGDSAAHFEKLLGLVLRRGFRVPPMVAAAFRAIATLEGSLRTVVGDFDLLEAARSRTGSMIT